MRVLWDHGAENEGYCLAAIICLDTSLGKVNQRMLKY